LPEPDHVEPVSPDFERGIYVQVVIRDFGQKFLPDPDAETEWGIKWSAASLSAGGRDITVSFLHSFFLAMRLHPEVWHKSQEEFGHSRCWNRQASQNG